MPLPRKLAPLTLVLALLALLAGCGGTPISLGPRAPDPSEEAELLLSQDRYLEAAESYMRLAFSSRPPERQHYQLRAAEALLDGGEIGRAATVLASAELSKLPADARLHKTILLAQLGVLRGETRVFELLPDEGPRPTTDRLAQRYHQVRAAGFEQIGDFVGVAKERIARDYYLPVDEAEKNRRAIWAALSRAAPGALRDAQPQSPNTLRGWLELALIARQFITDPITFEQALGEWFSRYPGHPANASIVTELKNASLIDATPPAHIALLLPFDGAFAKAATAVRDGFLAAWFNDAANPERSNVSIWNTADQDIWAVYRKAMEAGADFVVGPLDKDSVRIVASSDQLPVSTLALNYAEVAKPPPRNDSQAQGADIDVADTQAPVEVASVTTLGDTTEDPSAALLYQFALSPEAEARRVAQRAWFDGYASAALVTPEGSWGQRVGAAFTTAWEELGGLIAEHRTYQNNAKDMSEPVAALLDVDESEQRWQALKQYLGLDIKHEPRRRRDIGFVFMAAFPKQARQLRPQLKFHHAADLPVYATSNVYAGVPNATADADIDGVLFGDMPWVLFEGGAHGVLRPKMGALWGKTFARYARLYAFGVDAYAIVPQLGRLRAQPYIEYGGETGWLSVAENNRLQRRLTWAQFTDGVPQPTESSGDTE